MEGVLGRGKGEGEALASLSKPIDLDPETNAIAGEGEEIIFVDFKHFDVKWMLESQLHC